MIVEYKKIESEELFLILLAWNINKNFPKVCEWNLNGNGIPIVITIIETYKSWMYAYQFHMMKIEFLVLLLCFVLE